MATRFYCGASTAVNLTPSYSGWNVTTNAVRRRLSGSKSRTTEDAIASKAHAVTGASGDEHLWYQFVGEDWPLAAQTINSGSTVTLVFRIQESNALSNVFLYANVRIMSSDGATERGSIAGADATEAATSLTSRTMTLTFGSNISVSSGDIVVVEVGFTKNSTTSYTTTISSGDNSATDLDNTDADTGADNPWIEFSQTLTFATTRFYLPSSGTSALGSLARHSNWFTASGPDSRYPLVTTKTSTANSTVSNTANSTASERVIVQFVSEPLNAQTIRGCVRLAISCKETSTSGDQFIAWHLRVVSNDGTTERGVLYDDTFGASDVEFGASFAARISLYKEVTALTVSAGDRLVFELGTAWPVTGTTGTGDLRIGDNNGSDLPWTFDDTSTADPWVEINFPLSFQSTSTSVPNQLMLMGCGT